MNRAEWITELQHRINKANGEYSDFVDLLTDEAEDILALMEKQGTILDRLRSTMEDMIRGNAPEEVSYLLSLMNE